MRNWIADAEWYYRGHLNNRHPVVREEARDCHELLDRSVRFSLEHPIRDGAWCKHTVGFGDFAVAHTVFGAHKVRRIALVHCCEKHCLVTTLHGWDWEEDCGRTDAWPIFNWRRADIGIVVADGNRQWCEFRDVPDANRLTLERSAQWSFDAWQEAIAMGAASDGQA